MEFFLGFIVIVFLFSVYFIFLLFFECYFEKFVLLKRIIVFEGGVLYVFLGVIILGLLF